MDLDFIYQRHSVRKFKDNPVPKEEIEKILQAAVAAPSGKNKQNWHFVVVTDPQKIEHIADLVVQENERLAGYLKDEATIKAFKGSVAYHTVFKGAPTLILAYVGPYPSTADLLFEAKVMSPQEAFRYATPDPRIQNIAAAMENLHLAAAALGYGTCWMTGPTYAAEAIDQYLGFSKDGYALAAITPLGVPAQDKLSSPPRKPLAEVVTFIS